MNRYRRQGFGAGVAFIFIISLVVTVMKAHGTSDPSKVTWNDIAWFLFLMLIFASCVISLYKYWKDL